MTATVRIGADEAVGQEARERLPDDGRLDRELRGDGVLVDGRAGLELAADDPSFDFGLRAVAPLVPHTAPSLAHAWFEGKFPSVYIVRSRSTGQSAKGETGWI